MLQQAAARWADGTAGATAALASRSTRLKFPLAGCARPFRPAPPPPAARIRQCNPDGHSGQKYLRWRRLQRHLRSIKLTRTAVPLVTSGLPFAPLTWCARGKVKMAADLSARDAERVKFAFSIYDFEGNGTMDAYYIGDCLRALNLNPTLAVIDKVGGKEKRKEKMIKVDDFMPIFAQVKKDKDAGSYEDFMEVLKLYDKAENGTMMYAELEHILLSLGERLEKTELEPVLKECCDEEDEDGFIPYEPFLKKMTALL